eukprot:scaffold6084_cov284-Chaetoceros_neogracile.AAC.1
MMFFVASAFLLFLRSFSVATVRNHRDLGTNTKWTQLGDNIDGEAADDLLGYSVAISGDGRTIVAGGPGNSVNADDGNSAITSGYAQVMEYNDGSWSQLGDDIVFEGPATWFGKSVSISEDGRAIVVGAPLNGANRYEYGAGSVRVFEYGRGYWNQLGSDIDGEAAGDQFGSSVAMSNDGKTIVVGGPLNNGNGKDSGHVRVFEYSDGVWNQLGADIDGEAAGDHFGFSVALSRDGRTIAVGGPGNGVYTTIGTGDGSGHARIFEYNGGSWHQLGADIDGEFAGDNFGNSVAMSGDGLTIMVGGPSFQLKGRDSGHVRVFEYIGGSWNQLGGAIDGDMPGDRFGISVSISGDGKTFLAAALQTGKDGSGYARVFEYSSESWTQLGGDIDGTGPDYRFGISVSMSQDGKTIAAGALLAGDGDNSGQVRVYTRPTTITVDKSFGFITIVGIVGGMIFFLAAGYFVWSRTFKTSSKTKNGATELVSIKGERGVFSVVAEAIPGSLDVPDII